MSALSCWEMPSSNTLSPSSSSTSTLMLTKVIGTPPPLSARLSHPPSPAIFLPRSPPPLPKHYTISLLRFLVSPKTGPLLLSPSILVPPPPPLGPLNVPLSPCQPSTCCFSTKTPLAPAAKQSWLAQQHSKVAGCHGDFDHI